MPHNTSRDAFLSHNRTVLLDALRAAGAASATIRYSGYGDSGNASEISILDANRHEIDGTTSVTVMEEHSRYVDGRWETSHTLVERSLHDALDAFADHAVDLYHPGFVNNGGGEGEITFDCAAATITMDHRDNYVESIQSVHDL